MTRLGLLLARFCSSAWIGAATLFVVVAIRQVTSRQFETDVTDRLVALRFPPYYLFGFLLVGVAFLSAIVARTRLRGRLRKVTAIGGLGTALVLMAADYQAIYRPLVAMITPPGRSRPPEFQTYHRLSEAVNTVELALVLAAAVALNWPERD
jgi:peptidoglycan/LPS O-acetylase OafA/YrhL